LAELSRKKIVLAILVTAVLIAAIFNIYAISESAGGFAIWNENEAYFFIHVDRRGDSSSYLLFPWILFKEYVIGGFAAAVIPSDMRAFLVVLHVTPAGVERHVVKLGSDPERYTPIDNSVYAMCPGIQIYRWTGDRFENVAQEEQERLGGIDRLTRRDFDGAVNGWSRRVFVVGQLERPFTMAVGDQFSLVVNGLGNVKSGAVSIDLQRPGRASEKIAEFETREGGVSRAEYRHAFRDPA
jgi:hypothetical protein